jgi:TfoX/Sxy family transcriptional regulator of competence genes
MAYDEGLFERLREIFEDRRDVEEKKMFGGIAFMVRGHMCVGIVGETLMARIGPDEYDKALKKKHVREMDFTGKPMKGFIYIDPEGFESDKDLRYWVALSETYAKSLPPKK